MYIYILSDRDSGRRPSKKNLGDRGACAYISRNRGADFRAFFKGIYSPLSKLQFCMLVKLTKETT